MRCPFCRNKTRIPVFTGTRGSFHVCFWSGSESRFDFPRFNGFIDASAWDNGWNTPRCNAVARQAKAMLLRMLRELRTAFVRTHDDLRACYLQHQSITSSNDAAASALYLRIGRRIRTSAASSPHGSLFDRLRHNRRRIGLQILDREEIDGALSCNRSGSPEQDSDLRCRHIRAA